MADEHTKTIDSGRLLSAKDILRGGDEPFKTIEVKTLRKGGQPGIIILRPLPARDVIAFTQLPDDEKFAGMIPLLAKAIVDENGEGLFSENEVKELSELRVDAFTEISTAITEMMGGVTAEKDAGEGSSGAPGSASHTN